MSRVLRKVAIPSLLVLLSIGCFAQQKTIVTAGGSKYVFDASAGLTQVDKTGKTAHMSPTDLNWLCGKGLETAIEFNLPDVTSQKVTCDLWAQVQPHTTIEQVPFSTLMHRLVEISPPYTDFARYRGVEIRTEAQGNSQYDATIVPDDVGGQPSCTVVQGRDPAGGLLYKYECVVKTESYSDAVALEKALVQRLYGLHLTEDQIEEHGIALKDEDNNECAPTGECAHTHMFASAMKDGKNVDIEAAPDFIRNNNLADLQMFLATGRHNPPDGVKSDSGTVTFTVLSHSVGQSQ
ncbi:MAG: hypothetical protein WBP63_04390, partial [Silvibacterium sp.]